MRLYSLIGATAVTDPASAKQYEPGDDGGFDLPDPLATAQLAFHSAGKPMWETGPQRRERLLGEELERRKDPATLLDAVNQLVAAAQATRAPEPAAKAQAAKPAAKAAAK